MAATSYLIRAGRDPALSSAYRHTGWRRGRNQGESSRIQLSCTGKLGL